jgi:hypothetical protein
MLHGPNGHLQDHILKPELIKENVLHVIGVISNPVRHHSRIRLAREWIRRMATTPYVQVHIVETAYGDRHHELEDICKSLNADFLPLRTKSNYWIKESMINVMYKSVAARFPSAKYFAWIDADVEFESPQWAQEALHQLQHFQVIQPWSECADLGPYGNVVQLFRSFGKQHQKGAPKQKHPTQKYYEYAHSGFAWCATRAFMEQVSGGGGSSGPLMDFCPLGSADHHMAFAMISETKDTIHRGMKPSFFRRCYDWQRQAVMISSNEVGYSEGMIKHHFHGPKNRRYYRERWQILVDLQFDPDTQLMHDAQGLCYITGNRKLEHAVHKYNLSRFEDSIEEY